MKQFLLWGVTLALVSMPDLCVAQTGNAYRVVGNSIRVTRASEWNSWIFQNDLVSSLNVPVSEVDVVRVETDGLRPVLFHREINVAPTSADFLYPDVVRSAGDPTFGGASVKSNTRRASNVIDDDLSTYWEPDTPTSFASRLGDPGDFHIDGIRNWELEIDLGRLVFADSVTIVFPAGQFEDEYLGQPVKSLALFASMGERFPFPLGNNLRFSLVGQRATGFTPGTGAGGKGDGLVATPGTEGRYLQMNFPLEPLDRADWDLDGYADITGGFIQYVRVKIIASDLWRHAYLGAGEEGLIAFEALPAAQRGALVYQRRTAGDLLVELQGDGELNAEQRYESLPEEKRGPILYYVKEVPRISEVKVWARGNNYAYQPERRAGASFEHGGLGAPQLATDGVYDTEWAANTWSPVYVKGTAWYDLGATFWVDNISVVNKRINQSHLGAFLGPDIRVSDGTLLKPLNMETLEDFTQLEDGLRWDNIISEEHIDNHTPVVRVFQEDFPMRKIRFLQLRDIDITGQRSGRYGSLATLAEIQLYGEGYPTSISAYSPPISLTDSRGKFIRKTLPRIAWAGDAIIRDVDPITGELVERFEPLDQHPDVRLQIQTRTSDQTDTLFTYFQVVEATGDRDEITKEAYDVIRLQHLAWEIWQSLPSSQRHASRTDDDGDGLTDEDPIDLIDNDGDGRIDEDGKKLRRAPRLDTDVDGELAFVGWSEWSESYLPTGGLNQATITSPNPRKFVQVRINISSDNPLKAARIRSLRIDLAPPLALELAGELAVLSEEGLARGLVDLDVLTDDYKPPRDVDPLQPQRYSYFTRASAPDPTVPDGFNEILVVTPNAASLTGVRLGEVRVAEESSQLDPTQMQTLAVTTRFDRAFTAGADGVLRDENGVELTRVETQSPDSLWVRFPFSLNDAASSRSHTLIEVQFESQNFRDGIEVASFVRSTDSEEGVFQRVDADTEDATELVDSSTARVSLAALDGSLLQEVVMQSVFTPNSDGINDELTVQFTLLKVLEERPLEVMFYDLTGRLVGEGESATATGTGKVGEQTFTWDGRDLSGNVVAPGIYVCRIKVEADDKDNESMRLVHVAY